MEAIEQVPKTALDVFRLLPEGTLCEVIDNTLYMSPAPQIPHQELVTFLVRRIGNWVENKNLGKTLVSPVDVYFDELLSVVQPDLLFIPQNNMEIIKEDGYIHGAPDLIIEVLSEDKKRDTVQKKSLYERAGVKEYFTVDPASKKIQCYSLNNGNYKLINENEGIFTSQLLNLTFSF
jgi:Uma2 family endonuclease